MPPERRSAGSAGDWLRYARSDLALCKGGRAEGVLPGMLCFHAQQAAEKSLKAVLVHHGMEVIQTHNIGLLLDALQEHETLPAEVQDSAWLTRFAVTTRYPGDERPVSREEHNQAVSSAERVVAWATRTLAEDQ